MSKNRDTRREILKLARELVQSRGFNGFSYQDLADRLGIRKASIHYHFPSKEDLAIALLEAYRQRVRDWASSPKIADATPERKLDYLFEVYGDIVSSGSKICPAGMFSSDWNTLSEKTREKLKELMTEQRRWLVRLIREGRESGAFSTQNEPVELTRLLFAGIQGAVQLARVQADPSLFESVARQLKTLVTGTNETNRGI